MGDPHAVTPDLIAPSDRSCGIDGAYGGPPGHRSAVVVAVLLAVSVAAGWHIVATADGFLLNNYPFFSPDSYDWVVEGAYLVRMLGTAPPAQPLLTGRNPVFVAVMALDALLGQRGLVFAVVSAAAVFATGWMLIGHLGRFRHPTAAAFSFLIIVLLAQVNFLRAYVLADSLCMALTIAAFLATLRAAREAGGWRWVATAAGLTALAGLTQEYGVFAPGVAGAVAATQALRRGERAVALRMAVIGGAAAVPVVVGYRLWFGFLPHQTRPDHFGLVRMVPDMIPFYLEAWTYTFLPLAPLLLVTWRRRIVGRALDDTMTVAAWIVSLAFMILCLLLQWPSNRFTGFFWPILVLALFRTVSARSGETPRQVVDLAVVLVAAGVLLQTLFVNPAIPQFPYFSTLALDPDRSWLVQFVRARPLDRMELEARCGSRATLCAAARPLAGGSPYQQRISTFYEWLMLDRSGSPDATSTALPPHVGPAP